MVMVLLITTVSATVKAQSIKMRMYVYALTNSAYVVSSNSLDRVTYYANGKEVVSLNDTASLAPTLNNRVFRNNIVTEDRQKRHLYEWEIPGNYIYSFTFGERIEDYHVWEISARVQWTENGKKKDTLFASSFADAPSNVVHITYENIERANYEVQTEAHAKELNKMLSRYGLESSYKGYVGYYFVLYPKDSSEEESKVQFYLHNQLEFESNDTSIVLYTKPYKDPCDKGRNDPPFNISMDHEFPDGNHDTYANSVRLVISKKGTIYAQWTESTGKKSKIYKNSYAVK